MTKYIGSQPATSFEAVKKDRFTGLTGTGVTLSHSVSSVQDIVVWVNNVKQDYNNYTVSGTALTLGGSLVSADVVQVLYVGRTFQTVNPSAASVGNNEVASTIITGQTALAATPDDTDELLISDAGTLKRIDYSYLKASNTPAFSTYIGSNQTLSDATTTKADFDTEEFDTDSAYDTSNKRFTVPSGEGGKYFFHARGRFNMSANQSQFVIMFKKNNNDLAKKYIYSGSAGTKIFNSTTYFSYDISAVETLSAGDYIEVFVMSDDTGGNNITFNSGTVHSEFSGYKLIGI